MKSLKTLFTVIGIVLAVAAAIAAIYAYRDRIAEFFERLEDRLRSCSCCRRFTPEEEADFDDI